MPPTRNRTGSKAEVIEFLSRGIQNGEFKPGMRIKETYVAECLGLSRAPVREALLELASAGLVRLSPNKGAHVFAPTAKQILDHCTLAGVLEGFAVASILPLQKEDFRRMETSINVMEHIVATTRDMSQLVEEEIHFHSCFLKVHDEFLFEFLTKCYRVIEQLLVNYWKTVYTPEDFPRRHRELYEVLRTGDPVLVEKKVREHIIETGILMSRFGSDMPGNTPASDR